jgi:hypothetical protein
VNDNMLIDRLALQVMHWRVGPDRFITGNRSWLPKWKFDPLDRIEHAFMLLDEGRPSRYAISRVGAVFQVEVECDGKIGRATGDAKARTITLALARSLGLEV